MILCTNLSIALPQTILCFLLMLHLSSRCSNSRDCMEKRLHEFHHSSIEFKEILDLVYLCVRLTAFVPKGVFYSLTEDLEMGSPLSLLFVILTCTILKKSSSVDINFFISLVMWMMLSLLFLPILTFLIYCLMLIQLIAVFKSILKLKTTTLFS